MNDLDWEVDDREVVEFFSQLCQQHGQSPRALDWGSHQSQAQRFQVLAQVGPLNGSSVLDVGCGQADFYAWLVAQSVDVKYTGLDITPRMIEVCQTRFPDSRFGVGTLHSLPLDFDHSYDYVMASGIFYRRKVEPYEFLRQSVETMFQLCRQGVAFNSLSSWSDQSDPGEFFADPLRTLELCRELTPRIVLQHAYHPRDFTVYLYK